MHYSQRKAVIFSELLEKEGSVHIHLRDFQSPAIKMFRVIRNISLPIINVIFKKKDNSWYNLRQIFEFSKPLTTKV